MMTYENTCIADHKLEATVFGRIRTWLWWKRHDRCNPPSKKESVVKYRIEIVFDADRDLTETELSDLLDSLYPQVEEPMVRCLEHNCLDLVHDAEFQTSHVDCSVQKIG